MSEHPLRTHTERVRDQRRIETLEAELASARQHLTELASDYTTALEALATARLWRIAAMLALLAMALSILVRIVS
jgi:hypothetical protein